MKKLLTILVLYCFLISCGGNSSSAEPEDRNKEIKETPDSSDNDDSMKSTEPENKMNNEPSHNMPPDSNRTDRRPRE